MLKKLLVRLVFWVRDWKIKQLNREIQQLRQLVEPEFWKTVALYKEMNQDKVYYLVVDKEKEGLVKTVLHGIQNQIEWDLPNIFIFPKDIEIKEGVNIEMYRFHTSRTHENLLVGFLFKPYQTVKELAKKIGFTETHMYNVVNHYIREGILQRATIEAEEQYITLTEYGKAHAELDLQRQKLIQAYKEGKFNAETNQARDKGTGIQDREGQVDSKGVDRDSNRIHSERSSPELREPKGTSKEYAEDTNKGISRRGKESDSKSKKGFSEDKGHIPKTQTDSKEKTKKK